MEKKFRENMQNDEKIEILANFLNKADINQDKIDQTISCLNEVILRAAQKSFRSKKMSDKSKSKKPKQRK